MLLTVLADLGDDVYEAFDARCRVLTGRPLAGLPAEEQHAVLLVLERELLSASALRPEPVAGAV